MTRLGYKQVLKPVRTRWATRRAQTRGDVEALVSWLSADGGQRGRGPSRRSVVFTLGAVRQVLAYGVAEGVLVTNAAVGVKPPRKQHGDTKEAQVWEPADLLRFREAADADDWAAGWRLTLCGLRRSEVMGMHWSSEDTGYVVVDELGRPVRPEAYSDRFTELCTKAGVPVVRLHSVRHTLALMLHWAGQAPADGASLLGHSVAVHLGTYVPRTESGANTAGTALGAVLAGCWIAGECTRRDNSVRGSPQNDRG